MVNGGQNEKRLVEIRRGRGKSKREDRVRACVFGKENQTEGNGTEPGGESVASLSSFSRSRVLLASPWDVGCDAILGISVCVYLGTYVRA